VILRIAQTGRLKQIARGDASVIGFALRETPHEIEN
jgi:hypothetical protein